MKKKVIVCGFGFMGQTHTSNILNIPELELAAIVNPVEKSELAPVAGNQDTGSLNWEMLQDIPYYLTLEEAFKSCDFDAAVICSPTVAHASAAIECISHGKDVFLEKPLCTTSCEAEEILAALKGKNTVFHVGHCVRYIPCYEYLTQLCMSGEYGRLKHLELLRITGVPTWGVWKDKDTSLKSISGPVYDLNIHDVDFALHLLGEPEKVSAERIDHSEKLYKSCWQYSSGTTVRILGGFNAQPSFPFRAGFTAFFENAVLEFSSLTRETVLSAGEESREIRFGSDNVYRTELEIFTAAINGRDARGCTPEEAAAAVRYCGIISSLL